MHESPGPPPSFREIATNAIRYWEPRRIIYNAILGLIVLAYFWMALPASWRTLKFDNLLILFFLAVLANLCYSAAYIVDIFAQFSDFRSTWVRMRWVLLAVGIAFASVITRFFALGFFSNFNPD